MDLDQLRKVIEIFESSSLSELEIEERGIRFRLAKGGAQEIEVKKEIPHLKRKRGAQKVEGERGKKELVAVRSPLVGTFYRSPSPDEEPFVEVGDEVKTGETVCIIEAMKVMNEITSELEGRVREILVGNGQPVEYDQQLFLIEET
jgi:acetyl-CoA carboxylase biotin carboxyl carrier protein